MVVIGYNLFLVLFMFYSGWKVIQLFLVTLPLYFLFHMGPILSRLFSPHTVWVSTSLCVLVYCILCRQLPTPDKRLHRSCGLWDLTAVGATKRVMLTFVAPVLLTTLTYWMMERGCFPCSSTPGFATKSTPPKPRLIGHRGCAFDFPENSLAAYERAVLLPAVVGLETDVSFSMDGVPYLLHDPHLIRTTDVQSKCPSHDPYANSSLLYYYNGSCPLNKLNVGMNFLRSNRGKLSPQEMAVFKSQKVPTFKQFLAIARRTNRAIIFDVNVPAVDHPYQQLYLNRTLEVVLASGLPHNKVRCVRLT